MSRCERRVRDWSERGDGAGCEEDVEMDRRNGME